MSTYFFGFLKENPNMLYISISFKKQILIDIYLSKFLIKELKFLPFTKKK